MTRADRFRELHTAGTPLLLPNPWDAGSARVLASLGFAALATTSGGSALTFGRRDGEVTREEALSSAAAIAAAVDVPVTADLEDGFAADLEGLADTIRSAVDVGLAGCSIEDYGRDPAQPIRPLEQARDRIAIAVEAAGRELVLTARCENHLHGRDDLADTITRLQAYAEAGADVVYAPGLRSAADISTVVREVDRPVNVLLLPGMPGVGELADLGVHRISIGGSFAYVAMAALVEAAEQFRAGSTDFFADVAAGRAAVDQAFG
jgi:2-methylisocitrate lyase-like PEP mutase family enzyme